MFWFYSAPGWDIFVWAASLLLVLAGGWLIASHWFRLEQRERLLAGLAIGLVCYLSFANWIGRLLPPFWTFFGSAILVFALGLASAFPFKTPLVDWKDWRIPGWLIAGLALFWLFFRVSKGMGLYDEYKNLALISTLANGWIPAVAHFGQPDLLRYHYGFHLLGASLMQLLHLMPWSAWGVSKSMIWSLSLLLVGLVGRRYLPFRHGGLILAGAVALAGGTRYLMLLLPTGWVLSIQQHVTLSGLASGSLINILESTLPIATSPQIGFPFAFMSGVNASYVMAHAGEQTIEPLLLMLTILLIDRPARRPAIVIFAVLFSFWALAAETSFALIAMAWTILAVWWFFRDRAGFMADDSHLLPSLGLLIAIPLILLQGGVIAALAQQLLFRATAAAPTTGLAAGATAATPTFLGFSLRWPPAVVSGDLGTLSIFDPLALFAGILDMGLVVVLLPWLTYLWWRKHRRERLPALFLLIGWTGVLIPLVLAWESRQDIAHITDFGVDVTVVLLVFMLAAEWETGGGARIGAFATTGSIVLALMCVPGVVLMGVQLTAAQRTILSEHYGSPEAILAKDTWGRLPRDSKVLGGVGTPSILTGQLTAGIYNLPPGAEEPIWEAMLTAPDLPTLLQHSFDFVFVDSRWLDTLSPPSQRQLENPCIRTFARGQEGDNGRFVEILDLRGCR